MIPRLQPGRPITGASAVLVPFTSEHSIDWLGFESNLARTVEHQLIPAVNMDTGYVQLLSHDERSEILARTKSLLGGKSFIAGCYVKDQQHEPLNVTAYVQAADEISSAGGTPIIFPSHGFGSCPFAEILKLYEQIAAGGPFLAFELGKCFVNYGRVFSLEEFAQVMRINSCVGIKHSSLSRSQEWARLVLRDQTRSDFVIYTGNDLAIDMVMYGSDYLLGLSAFAPDYFKQRDRAWQQQDERFYEINDWLQYLGMLAFRNPVPAYRHSMAQLLYLRGLISTPLTHPQSPNRPESDLELLRQALNRLAELCG